MKNIETDIVVIGSGVAGLLFAIRCSSFARVTLITKSQLRISNTQLAQGGISAVFGENDSFQNHINDTLIAGDGMCEKKVVEFAATHAPQAIRSLVELGTHFDRDSKNSFDLHLEGGHSANRIVHFKDETGRSVEQALIKQVKKNPDIRIFENHYALDLLTKNNKCRGVTVWNSRTGSFINFYSQAVMLATGGAGQCFLRNTNSSVATGDGFAMAARANARLKNMEFVQFHPTVFFSTRHKPFLITEAVRGIGAVLRNCEGKDFMPAYHRQGSLAPRDVVSQSIISEMKKTKHHCVYLDLRKISYKKLCNEFPNLVSRCRKAKINLKKQMIPVTPAAHYMCGGIITDLNARTTVKNLYASGETACTGLHGANRLASNSLLEAVLFSVQAAEDLKKRIRSKWSPAVFQNDKFNAKVDTHNTSYNNLKQRLGKIMYEKCGVIRTTSGLKNCIIELAGLNDDLVKQLKTHGISAAALNLNNMINTSMLIATAANKRKISAGCHYIFKE